MTGDSRMVAVVSMICTARTRRLRHLQGRLPRVLEQSRYPAGVGKQALARGGRDDASVRAVEQLNAQLLLK